MNRTVKALAAGSVAALLIAQLSVAAAMGSDIQPRSVDVVIFPGGSSGVEKTVTTPGLPPVVDICLLEDETGSFYDDIGNLQAAAEGIFDDVTAASPDAQFAVAGFRDYPVTPYGEPGDWVYRLISSMSADKTDWLNGVASLTAGGGLDGPEAQYDAIVAASGPGSFLDPTLGTQANCGWRDSSAGAQRVLVVATDATFHTPDGTHVNSAATTVAALQAQDITVIGLKAPGAGTELDDLAAATGGSVQALSSDSSNISAAILAGLEAVQIDVTMESNCADPISTTFAPSSRTVAGGDDAVFTETISVAADAPGGTYTCSDWALINGEPLADDAGAVIYESKTIKVPEGFLTGGGQINNGKGKTAEKITFSGNVGFLADFSLVGHWNVVLHNVAGTANDGGHFSGDTPTALQFAVVCGPTSSPPPANANIAHFMFNGKYNGIDGYTLEVWAADHGEPGTLDSIRMTLRDPASAVVYQTDTDFADNDNIGSCTDVAAHRLDSGNLQIHSGLKY